MVRPSDFGGAASRVPIIAAVALETMSEISKRDDVI
jgi:hypothetical protein